MVFYFHKILFTYSYICTCLLQICILKNLHYQNSLVKCECYHTEKCQYPRSGNVNIIFYSFLSWHCPSIFHKSKYEIRVNNRWSWSDDNKVIEGKRHVTRHKWIPLATRLTLRSSMYIPTSVHDYSSIIAPGPPRRWSVKRIQTYRQRGGVAIRCYRYTTLRANHTRTNWLPNVAWNMRTRLPARIHDGN